MNFNTTSTQTPVADELRQHQWGAFRAACDEDLLPIRRMFNVSPEARDAIAKEFERQKAQASQPVKCLSCGGEFVRAEDGSIPCGH